LEGSVAIFERAALMLAEANTIQKAHELKNLALTAADWAKRKGMGAEAVLYAQSYALEAERKIGQMLQETERAKGAVTIGGDKRSGGTVILPPESNPTLKELGLTKAESAAAQKLADVPEEMFEKVKSGTKTKSAAISAVKREEKKEELQAIAEKEIEEPTGKYDVIVIDPPWDVKKIERDCRPNQVELDYPTMTETELRELEIPAAGSCHIFLWTTHKYLPVAFELLTVWGFRYICTFVWHKPGGFQPVGLPQYNSEFALYARKGSPIFIDTKAFNVCFNAPRGKHSEKPIEFYETITRVTAGRRLDMFGRKPIDGFASWGKEI